MNGGNKIIWLEEDINLDKLNNVVFIIYFQQVHSQRLSSDSNLNIW